MDKITLGAFARSGNHYFQRLVEVSLINVHCDWLSHRISDWDNKKNKVTIVRHPLECVSSWISTTRDSRIDRADKVLEWYVAYHQKIQLLRIMTLHFDDLVEDPLGSINNVCFEFGLNKSFFSNNENLAVAMEASYDFVWANPDKSDYQTIQQEILSSRLYSDAVELFEVLCVPDRKLLV